MKDSSILKRKCCIVKLVTTTSRLNERPAKSKVKLMRLSSRLRQRPEVDLTSGLAHTRRNNKAEDDQSDAQIVSRYFICPEKLSAVAKKRSWQDRNWIPTSQRGGGKSCSASLSCWIQFRSQMEKRAMMTCNQLGFLLHFHGIVIGEIENDIIFLSLSASRHNKTRTAMSSAAPSPPSIRRVRVFLSLKPSSHVMACLRLPSNRWSFKKWETIWLNDVAKAQLEWVGADLLPGAFASISLKLCRFISSLVSIYSSCCLGKGSSSCVRMCLSLGARFPSALLLHHLAGLWHMKLILSFHSSTHPLPGWRQKS